MKKLETWSLKIIGLFFAVIGAINLISYLNRGRAVISLNGISIFTVLCVIIALHAIIFKLINRNSKHQNNIVHQSDRPEE
jgi:TctA family transporter